MRVSSAHNRGHQGYRVRGLACPWRGGNHELLWCCERAVSPTFLGQREQTGIENADTDFTVYAGAELPWPPSVRFDLGDCVSVGQP
jgi:hypothetical protein